MTTERKYTRRGLAKRSTRLRVSVSWAERAVFDTLAAAAGLSTSAYVRQRLGLDPAPRTPIEQADASVADGQ